MSERRGSSKNPLGEPVGTICSGWPAGTVPACFLQYHSHRFTELCSGLVDVDGLLTTGSEYVISQACDTLEERGFLNECMHFLFGTPIQPICVVCLQIVETGGTDGVVTSCFTFDTAAREWGGMDGR